MRARLAAAQHRAHEVLAHVHLPHLPTREEIGARASGMFVKTRSLDEIVKAANGLDEISQSVLVEWLKGRVSGEATGDRAA